MKSSHVIKSVLHFLRGNRTKIRRFQPRQQNKSCRDGRTSEFSCPIKEFCPGPDEPDSSTRNVRGRGNNNAHKITIKLVLLPQSNHIVSQRRLQSILHFSRLLRSRETAHN